MGGGLWGKGVFEEDEVILIVHLLAHSLSPSFSSPPLPLSLFFLDLTPRHHKESISTPPNPPYHNIHHGLNRMSLTRD